MRILFVAIGYEQLGISILSALAKQRGHDVRLAFSVALFNDRLHMTCPPVSRFFDDTKDVLHTIEHYRPDIIAFSPLSGSYRWSLTIAQKAKEIFPHVKTVFGGVHTTAVPERVIARPEVDYICLGEGDIAFIEILEAVEKGEVTSPLPNTRYKSADGQIIQGPQTGFIQDLDSLPFFDKSLWEDYFNLSDYYVTMASRGCPYRCTFCFNSFFADLPEKDKGKYVRYRSADHVLTELRWAKKRYNVRMIEFFDDVFTFDKKWLNSFLEAYKKDIQIPFQIFSHVNHLDEPTVKSLAAAGCYAAQIGVQSLDDEYKRKYLKRHETKEKTAEIIRLTKKYRIRARIDHMLGLPGEPPEAQETARQFYVRNTPSRIHSYWVNFYPGTAIQKTALEMGLITHEDAERLNEGISLDSFKHSHNLISKDQLKIYEIYQVIYKLLPYTPVRFRKKLKPGLFKAIPPFINEGIAFTLDLLSGLLTKEADHIIYAKYYLFHIYRTITGKLGFRKPRRMRHLPQEQV